MPNAPQKTMVCVTVQKTCERLIRAGAEYAAGAELRVVHVAKPGASLLGSGNDGEALDYLFGISRAFGAQMDMLRADDVVETIVAYAKKNAVECLVVGTPNARGVHDFSAQLRARLPGISVISV
ncbi:MAG: universal stress protein UspA [Oscillospiraceae bacterium]|jgi:K+-sensing histidine kinase KdpD|nr:universal stress protein UspA [Oscillospiraceae bacterium]